MAYEYQENLPIEARKRYREKFIFFYLSVWNI